MAAVNLDKMSYKDLADLEARVRKAMLGAKERQRDEFRQEVDALAAKRGISVGDVYGNGRGRKGGKVAVKYRNRENPSDTWTGRGRQPKWLVAALKKGSKINDFAL